MTSTNQNENQRGTIINLCRQWISNYNSWNYKSNKINCKRVVARLSNQNYYKPSKKAQYSIGLIKRGKKRGKTKIALKVRPQINNLFGLRI